MIIDTFSSLRAEKLEKTRDTMEVCFICGIDKQIFDRASDEPDGFKTHIKIDHNMWNYLYFIFLLWEQDKDDDDGLEQYVRRAIEADEISWMPLNKAMRLEQVASGAEVIRKDLKESIHATGTSLSAKLDEFQVDINMMFQQLMSTLKQESSDMRSMMPLNTLMEFDDQNGDDMTLMTENSEDAEDGNYGYHVSLSVASIAGLDLTAFDWSLLSLRVVSGNAFYSIGVIEPDNNIVFMDTVVLPLFDNVYPQDSREALIQVLYGSVFVGETITSKFLGEVHLDAIELLSEEEERAIQKTFKLIDSDVTCTMKIKILVVKANSFGRDDL